MDGTTEHLLIDLIPQGGFAGFLLYLYVTIKKEMKSLRGEAKQEEQQIRKESKEETQALRQRYDQVITSLNSEKESFRTALHDEIGKLANRVAELEKTAVAILTRLDSFSEKLQDLKNR